MKLATIRVDGATTAARLDGDELVSIAHPDVGALLAAPGDWRSVAHDADGTRVPLAAADFAPLIPAPEKFICVGVNYRSHCEEVGLPVPEYPTFFAKFHRALIGANDDIVLPAVSDCVDWEVELAVVIGAPARDVAPGEALEAVAGYTIVNDISMRDWQLRTSQFLQGKTFERSTPIGPFLVSPDEVDHARAVTLTCSVGGEVMQRSSTAEQVFPVAEVISYFSKVITLMPGDVIATGTPGGVGGARRPPRYLAGDDVVVATIDGLGEQRNRCVRPTTDAAR